MYELRDMQRLESIRQKVNYIDTVVEKYNGTTRALKDKEIARPAILMHLIAKAEQFSKLKDLVLVELLSDAIKVSMSIRNFIAHDYDDVNLAIVESTLRDILPNLKTEIDDILNNQHDKEKL